MRRALVAAAVTAAAFAAGHAEARLVEAQPGDDFATPRAERLSPPKAPGRAGELVVVPGRSHASGSGYVRRFTVEVEGGLRVDRFRFARTVVRTLQNHRSWGVGVQRVDSDPVDFRVTLASPGLTNELCYPLLTNGIYSCAQGGRAVLNADRWRHGAAAYGRDLRRYRVYMVNHEVGHLLGLGHVWCPEAGARAPVMMQQTKGVAPCRANPWPLSWEG